MTLRVTFDTNTLDLACRPELFSKNPLWPRLQRVRGALVAGEIQGCYPVSMLTIEGVKREDRAAVIASNRIDRQPEARSITRHADLPDELRAMVGNADVETFAAHMVVSEPDRKPLPEAFAERVRAAYRLRVLALKPVPRLGGFQIKDPDGSYYLSNGAGDQLAAWISKVHEVARAIEDRGLGFAQVKGLGKRLKGSDPNELWYTALTNAKDVHERRAVERAFGEWADGDAIAAHVAYGLDVFCSNDIGKSNAKPSVLDPDNRAWLTETYGVRFMTFGNLLDHLS